MKLYLLRHGMTEANERHLYCGSSDLPLSEGGMDALAQLREAGIYPSLRGLRTLCSGMQRTTQTFELLFGDTADGICPGLREIDFGEFELQSYETLRNNPAYIEWIGDATGNAAPPKGESANEFRQRVLQAAEAIDKDALVVCHGGVIAALMTQWFPGEGRHMYAWQPGFGRGYLVEFAIVDGQKVPRAFAPI